MSRARTPMPSVGLVGVGGASTKLGRLYPAQLDGGALSSGAIIPQVIPCPWSTDEAGISIPAGTLAVRTMLLNSMSNEYAYPLTDADASDWVLVPSSLPSGWTKRGRDSQRGAPVFSFLGPPTFASGTFYRGTPGYSPSYFTTGHGITGFNVLYNEDKFFPAPIDPGKSYPQRRDTAGLQDVTVYPLNCGMTTVQSFLNTGFTFNDYHLYPPLTDTPKDSGGQYCENLGGGCWFQQHFGWRNIRIQMELLTSTAANPSAFVNSVYVRVAHNADNSLSGTPATYYAGDTIDYVGSVSPSWSLISSGGGTWRWRFVLDLGAFMPTGTPVLRAYFVSFVEWFTSLATMPTRPLLGQGTQYCWMSPRLDIPLWFTVTGRNLVAPGGLPP